MFLTYENFFEKNSQLNLKLCWGPDIFTCSPDNSPAYFLPEIHQRSSCRTWASMFARRTGSIWTWPNLNDNTVLTFWLYQFIFAFYFDAPKLFPDNVFSSVVNPDSDPHGSTLILVVWIWIQESKMTHKNIKMRRNLKFWSAGSSLWGLKASPVAWSSSRN